MNPTFEAFLRSWPFEPWVVFGLLLTMGLYLRGWLALHQRDAKRWPVGRPVAFGAGLSAIFFALASPIEPFTSLLLQVHMLQHLLLTMVAPSLIWLGAPSFPLMLGLPRPIRRYWVAPLFRSTVLRRVCETLTYPLTALLVFSAATVIWHLPPIYEVALRSNGWHYFQHVCFLGTALLFWYPVVRPYPSRPSWSPWLLIPYLIIADVQNTILSAVLTFSDRPLYSYYVDRPRLGNLSALDDQAAAGVMMWVPGSLAYLIPLFVIGVRLLFGTPGATEFHSRRPRVSSAPPKAAPSWPPLPIVGQPTRSTSRSAFDVLRIPGLGQFLQWRHARLSMQFPLVLVAALMVYDGLRGPPIAAMNLAGVLPWIHWRGIIILGLLALGNVCCMACPFTAPRKLASRWLPEGRNWPRWLRSKWLAVGLLVLFLWAYEAFSLWDSPWWSAWIAIAYFVLAFVVDGFFRGAAFCKYVCPIGQFNFVQSLVSPLEVKIRDHHVCSSCETHECIRGGDGVPGCELGLFQPRKAGNMDCTFCLDCIHACPHDNVGILVVAPGRELWRDSIGSGVGRFSKRPDVAALVVVLTFGALANAAGMVGPVVDWRDQLTLLLRLRSPFVAISLFYVIVLIVAPLVLVGAAAALCRRLGRIKATTLESATRFSYALMPIGFSMWLAHYSFHFLTSGDAVTPALQRIAGEMGWPFLGAPEWASACCRPVADWLPRLEIVFLDLGLLLSLYAGYRIALTQSDRRWQAVGLFAPWAVVIGLLFAADAWVVLQPMQMRGVLRATG
jgi:cytochrome c oxidase assembly factor CtaG